MYRIILVDDEANVLAALRRELRSEYEIETFTSPVEALQRCGEVAFDLVVSDYKMPEMNGIQFIRALAEIQPDTARILLSGQADIEGLLGAINDTHVYRFIAKPWEKTDLKACIAQALAYRDVVRTNRLLADTYRDGKGATKFEPPLYRIVLANGDEGALGMMRRGLAHSSNDDMLYGALHQGIAIEPVAPREFKFEAETFTSGKEALAHAKTHGCDLVITADLLPDMDGIRFLAKFQAIHPDAARVMISDHPDNQMLAQAINEARVHAFLNISWSSFELKTDIRRQSWNFFQLKSAVMQALTYRELLLENRRLAELARNQLGNGDAACSSSAAA